MLPGFWSELPSLRKCKTTHLISASLVRNVAGMQLVFVRAKTEIHTSHIP